MINLMSQILISACASYALIFAVLFVRNYIKYSEDEVLSGATKNKLVRTRSVKVSKITEATYLMHDAQTEEFICQGVTLEALWTGAKVRFPEINLIESE